MKLEIIHKIKMDLAAANAIRPKLNAVQGDCFSRTVQMELVENGKAWPFPEGALVTIRYSKSDGTCGMYDTLPDGKPAWSAEGNTLRIKLAPQMLSVDGLVLVQAVILHGESRIATFGFNLDVERDPCLSNLESQDYVSLRTWVKSELDSWLEQAKESGQIDGKDGTSVTVTSVIESTEDGGSNVITFSDGKTLTIKNGRTGATGPAGMADEAIPDYVRTEAETVARIVNQHQSNDSIVFPFLSDAHCGYYTDVDNSAVKLAGLLLDQIGKRVPFDFIANGGDLSTGAWNSTRESTYTDVEDYTELTRQAHKGVPALWAIGNHDDAPYQATADRLSQKETFALFGRKNRASGAVCPNGCNYGYLDLESQRLRVICLDTDDKRSWGTVAVTNTNGLTCDFVAAANVGGNQLDWLADVALDFTGKANPAAWSVVVISHAALNLSGSFTDPVDGTVYAADTKNAATILNAYRGGKSGSITHNGVTVDYDFLTLGSRATVICCVHGHNHMFSDEMVGGILSIGCPNVMNGRERESADGNTYTKTAGTADGTSFCILTIDRENCQVYAHCVGAGYDREFEYETEVIPYTNQIPISTDINGNIYNGKGFKGDTYISSGNEGVKAGSYTSGYIPCAVGDTLHFKNVGMQNNQDAHRVAFYAADKSFVGLTKTNNANYTGFVWADDGNISEFIIRPGSYDDSVAYVRFCCAYIGEDSIVTVNEPIG